MSDSDNDGVKKVAELMKDAHIGTLTTINEDGQLVSRPMGLQQVEFDGDAWFFTYEESEKIHQIQLHPEVNLAFQSGNSWVSVAGRGELVHDHTKAEELWNPLMKAWFPGGVDQAGLALLKVHADSAEYWDSNTNKVTYLIKAAKAAITGKQPDAGENKVVDI